MKKLYLLFIFYFSFFTALLSFAQVKPFELAVGDTMSFANGFGITETSDGGLAVGGTYAGTNPGQFFYVVKLNNIGKLEWTRIIGGGADIGFSITQAFDKGLIISGVTLSYGFGSDDIYIIKLDSGGHLKWTRTIGGTGMDVAESVIQTSDSGIAICGYTDSYGAGQEDIYVVKLDCRGYPLWTKTIGGAQNEYGEGIVETSDKGLAIVGATSSYGAGKLDVYVVKLDSAGNLKWTKTIGGPKKDVGTGITHTNDKGLAIVGYTESYGAGGGNIYVVKLDSSGNLKWTRAIGGVDTDWGYSIVETWDRGLAIAGYTTSYAGGGMDAYIVKLDSAGNLKWTKTIGKGMELTNSIIQTSDKGLAVTGITSSYGIGAQNIYVLKLDSTGNLCHPILSDSGRIGSGGVTGSGGSVSSGGAQRWGGLINSAGSATYVCGAAASVDPIEATKLSSTVYPNPNNGIFTIQSSVVSRQSTVEVYNMLGEKVYTTLCTSQGEIPINLQSQPTGIYLYRVTGNDKLVDEGKFVIQ